MTKYEFINEWRKRLSFSRMAFSLNQKPRSIGRAHFRTFHQLFPSTNGRMVTVLVKPSQTQSRYFR